MANKARFGRGTGWAGTPARPLRLLVGLTVLVSAGFFWQARDWNSASRLMLTYALAERGTVWIDGLQNQTRDRAYDSVHHHWLSDKAPGQSLLGAPIAAAGALAGAPPHPLGDDRTEGLRYWRTDYFVTLGTSGVAAALIAGLIYGWARRHAVDAGPAAIVALAATLATIVFPYSTVFYGHVTAGLAVLAGFCLVDARCGRDPHAVGILPMALAGFLAAAAGLIEYPVGLVGVAVGVLVIVEAIRGSLPRWSPLVFTAAALVPLAVLLGYNRAAFGNPLVLGYFRETTLEFRSIHSPANPLGLGGPQWSVLPVILFSAYRGLFWFSPVLLLAVPGSIALAQRRDFRSLAMAWVPLAILALVNISYPAWNGGFSTGPRFLVPAVPFLMLAVAALWGRTARPNWPCRWRWPVFILLALWSWAVAFACTAVGPAFPPSFNPPLTAYVIPRWRGGAFTRTVAGWWMGPRLATLAPPWRWLQFTPLLLFQGLMLALIGSGREARIEDLELRS